MAHSMAVATLDNVSLEYEVIGDGEPVVYIHGALIADAFRPLLDEPSIGRGFRHVLYRRRGHAGSSPTATVTTMAEQAADCRALLTYLGIATAHVVGHSYGGSVALQLAIDHPEVVHTLAVLEPALMVGASADGYRASLTAVADLFRTEGPATIVDRFLEARWTGYRTELDRMLPGAFEQAVADAATFVVWEIPGLLDWSFEEADARRIACPVLSVLGGRSAELAPRFEEAHRTLLGWLPRAKGAIIPGANHLMQLEAPGATGDALAAFWLPHPIVAESGLGRIASENDQRRS